MTSPTRTEDPTSATSRSLRRRGALVLAPFALLWSMVAASGLPAGGAWAVRAAALVVTLALVGLALRSTADGRPERVRSQPEGWHRLVGLVNLGEVAAIVLVVVVCLVGDVPQLVPPLVALVVGVHFVPLARLFDQPEYRATAAGLVVAATAGLALLVVSNEASRTAAGGLTALTLWATSALLSARR